MKNMKIDKSEYAQPTAMPEGPSYPYGLEISLNDECIKKLGIKELPAVGDVFTLRAKVSVSRVNKSESLYGENRDMALQITDMELSGKGE